MAEQNETGAPEFFTLSIMGSQKWLSVNAMRNSKGELLNDVSRVDNVSIVLEQERESVRRFGDRIHEVADRLLSIFVVRHEVLAVFQEYRIQPHAVISKCVLLNKKGKPLPEGEDYAVMHFSHDARYECRNNAKEPIKDDPVLPAHMYYYCHRHLVPPLDFFQDIIGWMFSARLVERIRQEKFTNFEFDRVILE